MQWLKFNLIVTFILFSAIAEAAKFTSKECLDAKYNAVIEHKGKFFGLLENKLSFYKEQCNLEIRFKGVLETIWKIDVCREPIHMKVTSKGSQEVYKREKKCEKTTKSDYCYFRNELMANIEDHGLIYAEGDRESLNQPHGQIYCSYLLIQRYVDDGYLFSIHENPKNIYQEQTACEIPSLKDEKNIVEEFIEKKDEATSDIKREEEKPKF
jgi:hypothetical protein